MRARATMNGSTRNDSLRRAKRKTPRGAPRGIGMDLGAEADVFTLFGRRHTIMFWFWFGSTPYGPRPEWRYQVMSSYEALRDAMELDAAATQPKAETRSLVCILCESGYHDAEWETTHVMQCGCPCHVRTDSATAGQ